MPETSQGSSVSAGVFEALTTTTAGRRAHATTPYLEAWAARYWRSQQAIERGRLRQGKAKHRAHREPITTKLVSA